MKIRTGFVSNSSSSSFVICNKTSKPLKMTEFVEETEDVIRHYVKEYRMWDLEQDVKSGKIKKGAMNKEFEKLVMDYKKRMLSDAKREADLAPGDNEVVFGDEQGTEIGAVYDYALRDGGSTSRFEWSFKDSLR